MDATNWPEHHLHIEREEIHLLCAPCHRDLENMVKYDGVFDTVLKYPANGEDVHAMPRRTQ